jgi:hypothetical protein
MAALGENSPNLVTLVPEADSMPIAPPGLNYPLEMEIHPKSALELWSMLGYINIFAIL